VNVICRIVLVNRIAHIQIIHLNLADDLETPQPLCLSYRIHAARYDDDLRVFYFIVFYSQGRVIHGGLRRIMRSSLTNGSSGTYFLMSSFCVKVSPKSRPRRIHLPACKKGREHWRNNRTPTCRMSCREYHWPLDFPTTRELVSASSYHPK
jgi:hypothetical protein